MYKCWKLKIKWTSRERLWGCHNSRENFWRTLCYLCMRCLCSYRCFCFCWCRRTKSRKISTYAFQIRECLYVSTLSTLCVHCMSLSSIYILSNVPTYRIQVYIPNTIMHKNYIYFRQGKSKKIFLRIHCYFTGQYVCNLTAKQHITCKVIAGTELIIFGNIFSY